MHVPLLPHVASSRACERTSEQEWVPAYERVSSKDRTACDVTEPSHGKPEDETTDSRRPVLKFTYLYLSESAVPAREHTDGGQRDERVRTDGKRPARVSVGWLVGRRAGWGGTV